MIYKMIYKIQNLGMLMSSNKESQAGQKEAGRKRSMTGPLRFCCAKNLHGRVYYVQALKSGHAGPRVIRKQPNEYVK